MGGSGRPIRYLDEFMNYPYTHTRAKLYLNYIEDMEDVRLAYIEVLKQTDGNNTYKIKKLEKLIEAPKFADIESEFPNLTEIDDLHSEWISAKEAYTLDNGKVILEVSRLCTQVLNNMRNLEKYLETPEYLKVIEGPPITVSKFQELEELCRKLMLVKVENRMEEKEKDKNIIFNLQKVIEEKDFQ